MPTAQPPFVPTPARSPVPPTQPLPLPTIPEQIVELLVTRQQWLTSSEIAQALAIDLKVIQTELTPLSRQHLIRRRAVQRNVPEKYEYAAQSAQRLNTPIAVSA
jgi:predicted transcriptional regulator